MKNKIFTPIVLLALVLSGCLGDNPANFEDITGGETTYLGFRSTQITLPVTEGNIVESITLQTMRILVFSKETGNIVANRVFDISDKKPTLDEDGKWIIDLSGLQVGVKPGLSIVYVVLNESIGAVTGGPLTGALAAITNLEEMHTLVNTPLSFAGPIEVTYDPVTGLPIEPPFIMVTYDEFDIPANRPASNPYIADLRGPLDSDSLKGFVMDRTMARITIENVTNRSMDGTEVPDAQKVATSYVFINKMGLVNVTKQYMWSPNRFPLADPLNPNPYPTPVPPYDATLGYHTIDFNLENAELFYERTWDGSISAHVTANVTWRQYGTGAIYKVNNSAGVNSYGTSNPWAFDPNDKPQINEGNFLSYLLLYFQSGMGGGFDAGNVVYTNPVITPQVTGGYWDLDEKNISYYVPEHILPTNTDPTDATKLYVKASIARLPYIDEIEFTYDQDQVDWVMQGGDIKWYYPTTITELLGPGVSLASLFIKAPHPTVSGKVMHYIPGDVAWREATGTINMTVTGLHFMQQEGGSSQEFYIPIKNAPENPNDYNIYRNHEYKFSVHVLDLWPGAQITGIPGAQAATTRSSVANGQENCMVLRYEK